MVFSMDDTAPSKQRQLQGYTENGCGDVGKNNKSYDLKFTGLEEQDLCIKHYILAHFNSNANTKIECTVLKQTLHVIACNVHMEEDRKKGGHNWMTKVINELHPGPSLPW
eukprot:10432698-Ditylum_brightwellii.AAC.1